MNLLSFVFFGVQRRSVAVHFAAAVTLAMLLAAPLCAATPREQLLKYVPENVGFCLVLNDLRGHGAALLESPFVEQLQQSPLGKALTAGAEFQQLAKADKDLKELLGLDSQQLRDEIFGDAVVFAIGPVSPGKPEQEQGLILLHARDPNLVAKLIARLNAKQLETGDLKAIEEKQHQGAKYVQRTEKRGTSFYYHDGSLLFFSAQEELLRQAIEQGAAAKKDAEAPLARSFRELGAGQALLSLWVNPRAFDADLAANSANKNKTAAELAFTKAFAPYWKALDGVVVSISLEKDLKVRVGLRTRVEELPAPARVFLREASKPSELWRAIPDDALFAVAGRFDFAALFEMLGGFMTDADRKTARAELSRAVAATLGKQDFFKEVLPRLGPDCGIYLSAPPAQEKTALLRGVLAMRAGNDGEKPPFNQAVVTALHGYAQLLVNEHNKRNPQPGLTLNSMMQGQREVTFLANQAFPPGFQPALTLHQGYIVLANSPDALRQFCEAFSSGGAAKSTDEVPLLRASFKDLRRWLEERGDLLAPLLAEQNKLTKEEAQQRLNYLLASLQFLDRLEISQRVAPGQVVFTLTLRTAQPLRK